MNCLKVKIKNQTSKIPIFTGNNLHVWFLFYLLLLGSTTTSPSSRNFHFIWLYFNKLIEPKRRLTFVIYVSYAVYDWIISKFGLTLQWVPDCIIFIKGCFFCKLLVTFGTFDLVRVLLFIRFLFLITFVQFFWQLTVNGHCFLYDFVDPEKEQSSHQQNEKDPKLYFILP